MVLAEKGSHKKEVLAVLALQSVCQMSRKEREFVPPPSELCLENMFRLDESIFGGMVGYVPITKVDERDREDNDFKEKKGREMENYQVGKL